jgi:hypothetical protein
MSAVPAETQVLNALRDVLSAASLGAQGIHIMRGVDDAFEPTELPAVNLILVQEDIDTPSTFGGGLGVPLLQTHSLQLVVQVEVHYLLKWNQVFKNFVEAKQVEKEGS